MKTLKSSKPHLLTPSEAMTLNPSYKKVTSAFKALRISP